LWFEKRFFQKNTKFCVKVIDKHNNTYYNDRAHVGNSNYLILFPMMDLKLIFSYINDEEREDYL